MTPWKLGPFTQPFPDHAVGSSVSGIWRTCCTEFFSNTTTTESRALWRLPSCAVNRGGVGDVDIIEVLVQLSVRDHPDNVKEGSLLLAQAVDSTFCAKWVQLVRIHPESPSVGQLLEERG